MDQEHPLALQILTAAVMVSGLALLCLVAAAIALARAVMGLRGDGTKLMHDATLLAHRLRTLATETKPQLDTVRTGLATIAHRSAHTASILHEFGDDAVRRAGRQQTALAALTASLQLSLGPTLRIGRMLWRLYRSRV